MADVALSTLLKSGDLAWDGTKYGLDAARRSQIDAATTDIAAVETDVAALTTDLAATDADVAALEAVAVTTDEKDALAGTSGAPSSTNKYVTNADTSASASGSKIIRGTSGKIDGSWYQDALAAVAGLTPAADRLPYYTAASTAALATFTSYARTLMDDPDAATARSTLGLVVGTNVQAWDADLDTWATKTPPTGAVVGAGQANTFTTGLQDLSAATMKLPASAGYAPATDALFGYDTTQQCPVVGGDQGLTKKIGGTISHSYNGSDQLDASTGGGGTNIGTTETAFAQTVTIPANLLVVGKRIRIRCIYKITGTGGPNSSFRARLTNAAGTAVVDINPATHASTSNRTCTMYYEVRAVAAVGASAATLWSCDGVAPATTPRNFIVQTVSIPTNAQIVVVFTCQYSAATAGNTSTLMSVDAEVLN